jgi:cell division transport system permease protein
MPMSLPRHLFTPAFRYQHLGRSLAAIVGIMVFIASFAVAAEAVLLTAGYLWGRNMETRLTVEIPAVGDEASMTQAERVKQAVSVLSAMPNVGLVIPLSDDEVARLLSPWFREPELLKTLPLPTLIDVERKADGSVTAEQIDHALKSVVSDARVNDHGDWTKDVWRLVRGLTILGGLTIALAAMALVIAVNLICRTVIATEHETISLLHLMGAENTDIARHFQMQVARIVLKASAIGFGGAVGIISVLLLCTRNIADLSTLEWQHWVGVGIATLLVPFGATAIATFAGRLSVMRLIKMFP